jgi:hypothetical protein
MRRKRKEISVPTLACAMMRHEMITTQNEALTELKRLGFPDIFERITRRDVPKALVHACEPVELYYEFLPDLYASLPASQNYLPLWETNGESLVAYDTIRNTFIRRYYEDGYEDEANELLGTTYQQFVSAFFLELIDWGRLDELDELAPLFEYKHLDKLRAFAESSNDYEVAERRFISSIPD